MDKLEQWVSYDRRAKTPNLTTNLAKLAAANAALRQCRDASNTASHVRWKLGQPVPAKSSEHAASTKTSPNEITAKDIFLMNVAHGYPSIPGAEPVDWDISGRPVPIVNAGKLVRNEPQKLFFSDNADGLTDVRSKVTVT